MHMYLIEGELRIASVQHIVVVVQSVEEITSHMHIGVSTPSCDYISHILDA